MESPTLMPVLDGLHKPKSDADDRRNLPLATHSLSRFSSAWNNITLDNDLISRDSNNDDMNIKDEDHSTNETKMTDQERRKKVIEQKRKKQSAAQLQGQVEQCAEMHDTLAAIVTLLREEIVYLKTLLLAHKDCVVSQAQGLHGDAMNNFLSSGQNHQSPYGIASIDPAATVTQAHNENDNSEPLLLALGRSPDFSRHLGKDPIPRVHSTRENRGDGFDRGNKLQDSIRPAHERSSEQHRRAATKECGLDSKHVLRKEVSINVSMENSDAILIAQMQARPDKVSAHTIVSSTQGPSSWSPPKHEEKIVINAACADQPNVPIQKSQQGNAKKFRNSEQTEDLISSDVSSSEGDVDGENVVEAQKEAVLDRVMLRVHEMFDPRGFRSCGESQGSASSTGRVDTTAQDQNCPNSRSNGRSRKRSNDEHEDGNEDRFDKRRKMQHKPLALAHESHKKLACPYYKYDSNMCRSFSACCGPGWESVSRIKAHLYRVHVQPLHCRRCYAKFRDEDLLTEHARSVDSCAMRDPIPMEGFDKDQERRLRGRSDMFQAETEEEKWKIVYLILFPDTPLGEIPLPYYSPYADQTEHANSASPKTPELKQFDAYLRRELPRTIRKRLQVFLENSLGPIEETMKNELEGIVRDAQEALTRDYLGTAGPESLSTGRTTGFARQEEITGHSNTAIAGPSRSKSYLQPETDALAPYLVPPDVTGASMTDGSVLAMKDQTFAPSSDSTYQSFQNATFDEDWHKAMSNDYIWPSTFDENTFAEDVLAGPWVESVTEAVPESSYTGKGKGRASDDSFGYGLETWSIQK